MTGIAITGFGAVRAPALEGLPEAVRIRASRAERVTQLALSAAGAALAMAGLVATEGDPRSRLGIVFGTAFGCFLTNSAYQRRFGENGSAAASPRLFAATVSNAAAGETAIAFRLGGPSVTLTAGGVSGLVAIGHALDLLEAGQADVVLAGGIDAMGEALERWTSESGFGPGAPLGEGAATLVLERMEHARARSARLLGSVRAYRSGFADPTADDGTLSDLLSLARTDAGAPEGDPSWSMADRRRPDPRRDGFTPGGLAADGPMRVAAALERMPAGGTALVADVCGTGHAAVVIVRKAG